MHVLSGCDTISYCYVIGTCNGIVIKVLQDGYLLPILGDTDVTLLLLLWFKNRPCAAVAAEQDLVVQSSFLPRQQCMHK